MPVNAWGGQQITFASEVDPDAHYHRYIWVRTTKTTNTVRKLCSVRGHPEWAKEVLQLNIGRDVLVHPHRKPHQKVGRVPKLRNITQQMRIGVQLRLPGTMAQGFFFSVTAGDTPPVLKKGYGKYDVVDVPGRIGISRFLGYDPLTYDVPIQFEEYGTPGATDIETRIIDLERMAGRGDYPGAGVGPPAVIRVSVTDNQGNIVPLMPPDYQWSLRHQNAPLWRITNITWDDKDAFRNESGYRVRQKATVEITEYTPLVYVQRSVAQRARVKASKPKAHA